jgi:nucleotide-binding universal stress UspA family protein
MSKKIKLLVGYDGSACADAALADLKNAGLPAKADVVVISAADVFLPQGPEIKTPEPLRSSIRKARRAAKREFKRAEELTSQARTKLKRFFPGWSVECEPCADSPAWALVKKAQSWKPDLIVVGAHGHSNVGRFLGSVSQMVLTQIECSVRVGRACVVPQANKLRVMIGVDGSSDSKGAVQAVLARNWPIRTEFMLISVWGPKKSSFIERLAPRDIRWFFEQGGDDRDVVSRLLESYAKNFRVRGFNVTCAIRKGDPKRVLLKEAESWGANCIFVGARGLTHLKRLFMGGVSAAVTARATCSVEVVRS